MDFNLISRYRLYPQGYNGNEYLQSVSNPGCLAAVIKRASKGYR